MKYILVIFVSIIVQFSVSGQEREVELDSNYPISSFDLYVTENYFVSLDKFQSLCYLFDKNSGKFIKEINPTEAFPGFNWRPIKLEVLENDIFFTNSAPWAFLISKNNDSVRVFDRSFLPPNGFKFLSDSTLVGFYTKSSGNHKLSKYNTRGELITEFEIPTLNAKNLLYRIENFYLHEIDNLVYFINPLDNVLFEYSKDGNLISQTEIEIPSFDKINRDINPRNDVNQIINEVIATLSSKSYIHSSYKLDEAHLLIVVKHKDNKASLLVFNIDMKKITRIEKISHEEIPASFYNNRLYYIYPSGSNYIIKEKVFELWRSNKKESSSNFYYYVNSALRI